MYLLIYFLFLIIVYFYFYFNFNSTYVINARLMQHVFSALPVAQPVVGEMEMHSVAILVTLQAPLATSFLSKNRPNLI